MMKQGRRKQQLLLQGKEQLVEEKDKIDHSHPRSLQWPSLDEINSIETDEPIKVCQCCFEDITSEQVAATCSSNTSRHNFCSDCLRRYVEEWVFGGASYPLIPRRQSDKRTGQQQQPSEFSLPCLASQCESGSFVPNSAIERTVSQRVWEQYQEKMQQVDACGNLKATNHHNPSPSSQQQQAANTNTTKQSTDKIDPSSSSTTTLDRSYHEAEEALTDAKVRQCALCGTRFLKESNTCNKIRCPRCRRYCMCYICRQPVDSNGYDHFCRHQYDTSCQQCRRRGICCPLWSRNDDADDQSRLREVALRVANRVWEESLLNTGVIHQEIRLDVDRLLHDPAGTTTAYCHGRVEI